MLRWTQRTNSALGTFCAQMPTSPARLRLSASEVHTATASGSASKVRVLQAVTTLPARGPRKIEHLFQSSALGREVRLTVVLPPFYRLQLMQRFPLVLVNDGQDFPALKVLERLAEYYKKPRSVPRIWVGIHANERRMSEYGCANIPDYAGRGDLAAEYSRFVTAELLPWLKTYFRVSRRREDVALAGFSLGGLSAFDITWRHAHHFGAVACFSASFWWRSGPLRSEAPDADRIAIDLIKEAETAPKLDFYFMVGDQEESSDRNDNGVIDAIDDTLDVIAALKKKGVAASAIRYQLVKGGKHDQASWGPALMDWVAGL